MYSLEGLFYVSVIIGVGVLVIVANWNRGAQDNRRVRSELRRIRRKLEARESARDVSNGHR